MVRISFQPIHPHCTFKETKKRTSTTEGTGTSSQVPQRASRQSTNGQNRGNPLKPLGLTDPEHVARYNALSSWIIVATWCFDEDLLTS